MTTAPATVEDTIIPGRPEISIFRTYETCDGEFESVSDGTYRRMTGRVLFAIEIPAGLKPVSHWGDDYASSIDVFELPDGSCVIDRGGLDCCGYQARFGRERFRNRASFEAWKAEVRYVDREDRFPGVNPHRRAWNCLALKLGA